MWTWGVLAAGRRGFLFDVIILVSEEMRDNPQVPVNWLPREASRVPFFSV